MFFCSECFKELDWDCGAYLGDGDHICFDCAADLNDLDEEE